MVPVLPDLVLQRALSNGVAGREWLDRLPDVLASLAERWHLTIGQTFSGGTAGYVAAATDALGAARVLKVAMPLDMNEQDAFARSVDAHHLAGGRGCVELIDADLETSSMLLERLGPNLDELGFDVDRILDAITATLRSFWRPLEAGHSLPTGDESAVWLADHITASWDELGRPCPARVVDRAVDFCEQRAAAFDPADAVLVHGDAHGWNTLRSADGGYKFVDIEGLASEREHDLSVPMREYNRPLLAGDTSRLTRARAERLATACDVDPEAVWQWGFIERVSTGLVNLRDFDGDDGLEFLAVAERCVADR